MKNVQSDNQQMKESKWVLIRGLGREARHWQDFPEIFAQTLGISLDQILMLDLPGFGKEADAPSPSNIQDITDYMRGQFRNRKDTADKMSPAGEWHVLGISLGGMVVMDWVHRYHTDFSTFTLINSSASDLSTLPQRLTPFALYCMLRAAATTDTATREKQILKMISNSRGLETETLNKMVAIRESMPLKLGNLTKQLFAASRFNVPNEINVPGLILASIKDHMVDVRCSKSIAERFHLPIKFHASAGHDLTLDEPLWVAERVLEFGISLAKPVSLAQDSSVGARDHQ
jgi:pimeloyl-ACP methyl ester carboxylesterase